MVHRLLANPTVTFNSHSGVLPFVIQFESLILTEMGKTGRAERRLPLASLDSSSYGSVLTLTISRRVSTITVLIPVSTIVYKNYSLRTAAQMIKQDLIQRVVERTGLPRTKAESAVDAIFDSMKQTLIAGDRIELRGFGVFTVKPRKTGIGRNPRTGAEVIIAPGKAVRFKPGKELHLLD